MAPHSLQNIPLLLLLILGLIVSCDITEPPASELPGAGQVENRPASAPNNMVESPPRYTPINIPLHREAKSAFAREEYDIAAEKYRAILTTEPENPYALSDLAVICFRQGKMEEAEEWILRSLKIKNWDSFSLMILGLVEFRLGSHADALRALEYSVAADPQNADAHFYLAIIYSQKGWKEKMRDELLQAKKIREKR